MSPLITLSSRVFVPCASAKFAEIPSFDTETSAPILPQATDLVNTEPHYDHVFVAVNDGCYAAGLKGIRSILPSTRMRDTGHARRPSHRCGPSDPVLPQQRAVQIAIISIVRHRKEGASDIRAVPRLFQTARRVRSSQHRGSPLLSQSSSPPLLLLSERFEILISFD